MGDWEGSDDVGKSVGFALGLAEGDSEVCTKGIEECSIVGEKDGS